ncbi:hypothetical protein I79_023197 [Cricetulus griseus]|uniref:Uncharacterized protein n=1 Tax=Cricetulus griseus TaxID=10029 RepID=G3IHA9_CRIGR|nr:hypothetical protein I79_023197 [Cricetulus griseus]
MGGHVGRRSLATGDLGRGSIVEGRHEGVKGSGRGVLELGEILKLMGAGKEKTRFHGLSYPGVEPGCVTTSSFAAQPPAP